VVEELSDLHQHQRVDVIGIVHVRVHETTHQSGIRQLVTTSSNARFPYRYTPIQQKGLRMHADYYMDFQRPSVDVDVFATRQPICDLDL